MPTKIMLFKGTDENLTLIGFCKESPKEVLEKVIQTHLIHSYKQYYCRPVINEESTKFGLVIREFKESKKYGLNITGTVDDIIANDRINKAKYKKKKFSIHGLNAAIEYFNHRAADFTDGNAYKDIYLEMIDDLIDIRSRLQ